MYRLLKPILFLFDAETVHHGVFTLLRLFFSIPGVESLISLFFRKKGRKLSKEVFGIHFPNPVGLAAGFDKEGHLNEKWAALGFGFVEIGTVTPKPQPGNLRPRLFRLTKDKALLNRMGFNSGGMQGMVSRLKQIKNKKIVIGGNIGKNKDTPNENALNDYLQAFEALYSYVDYFTVNVSSPNTPGLRELQEKEPLRKLLQGIQDKNSSMPKPKPILLKIAPDLTESQIDDVLEIVTETGMAGIVATNTTISREALKSSSEEMEQLGPGGISGAPLTKRSLEIVAMIHRKTAGKLPVIGVGGIMTPKDAKAMLDAGASLVQIYSGFVYEGPGFVKKILNAIDN